MTILGLCSRERSALLLFGARRVSALAAFWILFPFRDSVTLATRRAAAALRELPVSRGNFSISMNLAIYRVYTSPLLNYVSHDITLLRIQEFLDIVWVPEQFPKNPAHMNRV